MSKNILGKYMYVLIAVSLIIPINLHAETYFPLIDVKFMKYERGIFIKKWVPTRFSGAAYNDQYVPISEISENYIRQKNGGWCRVYIEDIYPMSLYVKSNGKIRVFKHDPEDYLKFKC